MKPDNVLKNRNYLLLFMGSVVSNLGSFMYNVAISFYVLRITDNNAAIAGLYGATFGVVFFGLSLFGGAIVDRLDKVKVVVRTDLINGFVVLIAGVLIYTGIDTGVQLVVLFLTAAVLGVNSALFNPAVRSLPPHILEENQLQQANSLSQGMFAIYAILGGMIGGLMYETLGVELIFIINGVSFILSGISESFIQVKTKPEEEHQLSFIGTLKDIGEGLKYVVRLKPIFYLVAIASMLNFFTVPMVHNGLPYLFKATLEREAYYLSLLNSMFFLGIILTSIVLGSTQQRDKVSPIIIRGLFGMGAGMLFVLGATQLIVSGTWTFLVFMIVSSVALVIMGLFNGMINIPFGVAIMKTVEKDKLGRVYSVVSIISNGLSPIAMALGGFVIYQFGIMVLFYAAPVAMFVTAILAWRNKYVNEL